MEGAPVARYTINSTREVFIFGEDRHVSYLEGLVKGYYFINPRLGKDFSGFRSEMHFLVAAVDFTNIVKLQKIAKTFSEVKSSLSHKLLFAMSPDFLTEEHLLFANELGCRYVFSGPGRSDQFKDYIKRVCLEASQNGSLTHFQEEIAKARQTGDSATMLKIADRLKSLERETEESNLMLVNLYLDLKDLKRAEAYLRRVLTINPQNLWAANVLAKQYLRSGRASLGIELLQKLSHFHDLNSERMLVLGKALLVAGDNEHAEEAFEKGSKLGGGMDPRFNDGLMVARLAQGNGKGAAQFLESKQLSEEAISFLNLKAILATRQGKVDESLRYYDFALKGTKGANDTQAKLQFNMGLAYIRLNDLEKAKDSFAKSLELGGQSFRRAKDPLAIVNSVIAKKSKLPDSSKEEILAMGSDEWETLF